MKTRRWISLTLVAVIAGCGKGATEKESPSTPAAIPTVISEIAKLKQTIQVDGAARTYIVYMPPAVRDKHEPAPLVMLLHGASDDSAYAYAAYGMPELAQKENFIAVFPDGVGANNAWDAAGSVENGEGKDDKFLTALLAQMKKDFPVDPRRVYLCGHSSGAIMTGAYGARHSREIAALGIVAGAAGWETASEPTTAPKPERPIPVFLEHGKKDLNVPFYPLSPGAASQLFSPAESIDFWVGVDGGASSAEKITNAGRVTQTLWVNTDGESMLSIYILAEGNHMWPGGRAFPEKTQKPVNDIDLTPLMWQFFKDHPLPAAATASAP